MALTLDDKKVILLVTADSTRRDLFSYVINKHLPGVTIYSAQDGQEGFSKMRNVPPHVVVIDSELEKINTSDFIKHMLEEKDLLGSALVVISSLPEKEQYLDEIVIGKIIFLEDYHKEAEFLKGIHQGLNFAARDKEQEFYLKFLSAKEPLIKEGEKADYVYFVRRGQLLAYKNAPEGLIKLGIIEPGEFVGEMAYINGEPRSASVQALTDCELIEVPIGILDHVLYQKPSWSKALMVSLSKRLKVANNKIA